MSAAVDTVIVAYGSEAVIEGCVRAAEALPGATVVVDHGDGRSAQRARALGATAVHDPANPGFGAGQNRGMALTSAPYVLLCNPDATVDGSAVLAGRDFLEAHPAVAAVQGVVVNQATGRPERSHGVALGPLHLLGRAVGARHLLRLPAVRRLAGRSTLLRDHADRVPRAPMEVESLAATVVLVRRAAFDQVGGFDCRFFLYGEDLDLCRRLRRSGWTLVALPVTWALHDGGGSARSSFERELHWWRGTMQYGARWWTPGEWALGVAAAAVKAALLSVRPGHARAAWSALLGDPWRTRGQVPAGFLSTTPRPQSG